MARMGRRARKNIGEVMAKEILVDYSYRKTCKCECCGYYRQHWMYPDFDICPNCGEEDLIRPDILRKKRITHPVFWYKPWTWFLNSIVYEFDGWGRLPEHMECKKHNG